MAGKINLHTSYYQTAQRVWSIIFLSLPLDALLLLASSRLSGFAGRWQWLDGFSALLLFAALALTPQEFWLNFFAGFKRYRDEHPAFKTQAFWTLIGLFVLLGLFEIYQSIVHRRFLGLLAALVGYGAAIWTIRRGLVSPKGKKNPMPAKPEAPPPGGEEEIFYFTIIPAVITRVISLLGTTAALFSETPFLHYLVFLAVSVVLLLEFMPRRGNFVTACKGCAAWSSRARLTGGYCRTCISRGSHKTMPVLKRPKRVLPARH